MFKNTSSFASDVTVMLLMASSLVAAAPLDDVTLLEQNNNNNNNNTTSRRTGIQALTMIFALIVATFHRQHLSGK